MIISKELNDSFLTTLEEIKFADMLLIVIDASNNIDGQISTIDKSLDEIEMDEKEVIYVFNKMDKVEDSTAASLYKRDYERIFISAKDDCDLQRLKDEIVKVIKSEYREVVMHIPFEKGRVLDYFMTNYDILETNYDENGTIIKLEISKGDFGKYESYIS